MLDELLAAVAAETSGDRAHASVRSIAAHHRVQSSPGYDDAARWVADQLSGFGLTPEIEPVPGDGRSRRLGWLMPRGWECRRAQASLLRDGAREAICDYDAQPLSLILRSAPAAGTFPLVAVGAGSTAADYDGVDVRGHVALTHGPVHRVHEMAVVRRGAAGLLSFGRREFPPVRGRDDDDDAFPYTSFWWGPRTPRGWGFVVSPRTGRALYDALRGGARLALSVEIDSREFDTTIPLLSAHIPGSGPDEIVVISHLCHPRPSANDNASGAAALLETARVLETLRREGRWAPGERGVRFLWVPELTGTAAWFGNDPVRAKRVVAALNLDMVGEDQQECGSTMLLERPPCFLGSFAEPLLAAIRHRAQDWITSYAGPGHFSMTRMGEVPYGGGSDHAVFVDPLIGVPCPMLIQWPDRYYHSSHDTPDRVDPASLALAVRCAATYAGWLGAVDEGGARQLLERTSRAARREILDAADQPDSGRAFARARLRGCSAIRSVSRLLDEPARIAATLALFEGFCEREGAARDSALATEARGVRADASPAAQCPRRLAPGPLEFHPHLMPGFEGMSETSREADTALLDAVPGGRPTLDVAWCACDGRRSLDEIATMVGLETGVDLPVRSAGTGDAGWVDVFNVLERLGLVSWAPDTEVQWSLDAHDTATS
jgi:Peptidase family M28